MARVIKIDNALEKKFTNSKKKKKSRELVTYFLIVCEGEKTEPNYFKSFPKKVGKFIYDIKYDGGGISTLKVVNKAIELKNNSKQKYDRVWAVFDKDSFKPNSFNSAILKARAHGIKCAWSNQAFELWYLLHFHNRITAMDRKEYQKAIEEVINKKIKNKKKPFIYTKNSPNMYDLLERFGNQDLAMKWAEDLDKKITGENFADYNPNTHVYKLVEELVGKSEELNNEILKEFQDGK